jgi:hypothetical protein
MGEVGGPCLSSIGKPAYSDPFDSYQSRPIDRERINRYREEWIQIQEERRVRKERLREENRVRNERLREERRARGELAPALGWKRFLPWSFARRVLRKTGRVPA